MKNHLKLRRLLLLAPFIISNSYAMTPVAQFRLAKRLKAVKHTLNLRQEKTNAKGTITESTYGAFSTPESWFHLDPSLDDVQGVSTNRVYNELGDPTSDATIIVAVIDSGVDVNHEDLQGKIWINEDEIPNDGIDNDKNGYIDDIFGWNFIGNKDGMASIDPANNLNGLTLTLGDASKQVAVDSLEITREYARLLKLKKEIETQGGTLSASDLATLKIVEDEVQTKRTQALDNLSYYQDNIKLYKASEKILKEEGGLEEITYDIIDAFEPTTDTLTLAKANMMDLLNKGLTLERMLGEAEEYDIQANYYYNPKRDTRADIVKDNDADPFEKDYGNNDVIGPDSFHGTHVSGIIAANRNNSIGIKGIAKNVKIMALRCVPNGDERDKDVANSIRYAVDNGAKIINMSFGKDYSPYKNAVNDAVKYAQDHGVLIIHAAGNSYQDNDIGPNFPNRNVGTKNNIDEVKNWLEIGASGYQKNSSFAAGFSNYGKRTVDIFAPGVNIYSTVPGNEYSNASGTSMASPVTAGVAALVLSYDNSLSAVELKDVILNTTNRYPKLYVYKSRLGKVLFSSLSIFGGVPNAYNAVQAVIVKKDQLADQDVPGQAGQRRHRRSWISRVFRRN